MNILHSFKHYLSLLAIAILLLTTSLACIRLPNEVSLTQSDSSVVGKYAFTHSEAASEIELRANGTFTYVLIYGALVEGASGKWHSSERQVILQVDPAMQGDVTPPPTAKLELLRDGSNLVLARQSNELIYIKQPGDRIAEFDGRMPKGDSRIPVDIVGYNYTDRPIGSFNVNGYGAGRLSLSTPTSGGGSPMCCFYFMPGIGFPYQVDVEWAPSANEGPWTKTKALIPEPKSDHPRYLEIHFYPGGRIEGELTEDFSLPRLELTKKNPNER